MKRNDILAHKRTFAGIFFLMMLLLVCFGAAGAKTDAAAFRLNKTSISGYAGSTYTLKASGAGSVKYSSTNKSVCTVSAGGKVTLLSPGGTAKIKAVSGSKTLYASVTVKGIGVTVKSNQSGAKKTSSVSAYIGEKYTLTVTHTGSKKVSFSSTDKKVCTVSKKGVITVKGSGTAKIKVSCGKSVKYIKITAAAQTLKVPDKNLYVNEKETITVKSVSIYDSINWKSSDTSVIEIKSQYRNKHIGTCNIIGLKAGTATLTGTSSFSGKKWTIKLTVYPSGETQKLSIYANNAGVSNSVDLSAYISLKPGDSINDVTYEIYDVGVKGSSASESSKALFTRL